MTNVLGRRVTTSVALIFLAFPSYSESDCADRFLAAHDGSISDWSICSRGDSLQVVAPGENQFGLELLTQGRQRTSSDEWRPVRSAEDPARVFIANDAERTIQIKRTYRTAGRHSISQEISVTNLSDSSVTDFRLVLELGGRKMGDSSGARSLADYVYGYHRIDVAQADSDWLPPSPSMDVTKTAITSRSASLILQFRKDAKIEPKVAPNEDPPSPFYPNDWQVVLGQGDLQPGEVKTYQMDISALPTMTEAMMQAGFGGLVYADVWRPLGAFCRWVEAFLRWLSSIVGNLGIAIILFAIATRLVTLPASIWAARRQQEYKVRFARAKPQMDMVRKEFKGAEQSERILEIYKESRITPFSGLKGSIGLLAQIPFLLAVFNVTTRSSIFAHEQFLWISNLALPDAAFALPIVIPILGGSINALPLALGALNITSSLRDDDTSRASKIVPIAISLLIVTVFYSFSAALVLYWLTINLLQAAEKKVLKLPNSSTA